MKSLLFCIFFIGVSQGEPLDVQNWAMDLANSIANLQANINRNIRAQLAPIDMLNQRIAQQIANMPTALPVIINGSTFVTSGNSGVMRSIVTGHLPNGEPYVRDIEERVIGHYLYHYENSYNPRQNTSIKVAFKLNLSVPGATPVILNYSDKPY